MHVLSLLRALHERLVELQKAWLVKDWQQWSPILEEDVDQLVRLRKGKGMQQDSVRDAEGASGVAGQSDFW